MSVSRGKIHEYLGMILDYTVCSQVRITMISYFDEILAAFDETELKVACTKTSNAFNNLFVVNNYCKKLNQNKVVEFHNLVANNLYATKRSRLDT